MNTKPLSLPRRKLALFIAFPLLAFSLFIGGTFDNAGDRDSYTPRKVKNTQYKKPRKKGLLQALVDHHRKERSVILDHHRRERAFILGLITGGNREYYEEEEYSEPVREYRREPVRRYEETDREPVRRYRKPDPQPEPVRTPAPVSPNSNYQYPGYSGY